MSAEDANEGAFQSPVEVPEPFFLQLVFDDAGDLPGDIGVFRRVFSSAVDLDFEHLQLLFAGSDEVGDRDDFALEVLFGQFIEAVAAGAGIEEVVADHGVEPECARNQPRRRRAGGPGGRT